MTVKSMSDYVIMWAVPAGAIISWTFRLLVGKMKSLATFFVFASASSPLAKLQKNARAIIDENEELIKLNRRYRSQVYFDGGNCWTKYQLWSLTFKLLTKYFSLNVGNLARIFHAAPNLQVNRQFTALVAMMEMLKILQKHFQLKKLVPTR